MSYFHEASHCLLSKALGCGAYEVAITEDGGFFRAMPYTVNDDSGFANRLAGVSGVVKDYKLDEGSTKARDLIRKKVLCTSAGAVFDLGQGDSDAFGHSEDDMAVVRSLIRSAIDDHAERQRFTDECWLETARLVDIFRGEIYLFGIELKRRRRIVGEEEIDEVLDRIGFNANKSEPDDNDWPATRAVSKLLGKNFMQPKQPIERTRETIMRTAGPKLMTREGTILPAKAVFRFRCGCPTCVDRTEPHPLSMRGL